MNSSQVIVLVCSALVTAIVAAAIFSPRFRSDILASDGDTKVFNILSISGAALVLLSGLFMAGAILAAYSDNNIKIASIELALSQSNLDVKKRDSQLEAATARLNSQDIQILELKKTIAKMSEVSRALIFKTTGVTDPPYCDSAGSPSPVRVPDHNAAGLPNLALLIQAVASASSVIPDTVGARHRISNLNDGWYNNCRSWIPSQMPAWAQIDLGKDFLVSSVVLGSEHQPFYNDRAATAFSIKVASNQAPDGWQPVVSNNDHSPLRNTTPFSFQEVRARYIRFEITESINGHPRVDEFEIYGRNID